MWQKEQKDSVFRDLKDFCFIFQAGHPKPPRVMSGPKVVPRKPAPPPAVSTPPATSTPKPVVQQQQDDLKAKAEPVDIDDDVDDQGPGSIAQ